MQKWGRLFLFAVIASACDGSPKSLVLSPRSARSVIVVLEPVEPDRKSPLVFAFDLDPGARVMSFPLESDPGLNFEAYALHYACSLADLHLASGAIRAAAPGDRSRPLPRTRALSRSSVRNARATAWSDISELPVDLVDLRLVDPTFSPCVELRVSSVTIPESPSSRITVAVDAGNGDALVALSDGRFFLASPERAVPLVGLSTTTPHDAGFRSTTGEIWLSGLDGRVLHGHPDSGFLEAPSRNVRISGENQLLIDGPSTEAAPFELFSWIDTLILERFDGTAWSIAGDLNDGDIGRVIGLAWVAVGEAIAVSGGSELLLHYRNGTSSLETLGVGGGLRGEPHAVRVAGDFGPVVGTIAGELFYRDEGVWKRLGNSPIGGRVLALAPFGEGLVVGGDGGGIAQYFRGYGFCELDTVAPSQIIKMVPVGQSILLITRFATPHDTVVTFLTPTSPLPRCAL